MKIFKVLKEKRKIVRKIVRQKIVDGVEEYLKNDKEAK